MIDSLPMPLSDLFVDDPMKHPSIVERFGKRSQADYQRIIGLLYLLPAEDSLQLVCFDGTWACGRPPANSERGDQSSKAPLRSSIEELGLLTYGGGPWVLEVVNSQKRKTLHWGSRIDVLVEMWRDGSMGRHPFLSLLLSTGVPGCKCFKHNTPSDVLRQFVDLGNVTNSSVTDTTPIEVLQSCARVELAFEKRRRAHQWTIFGLTLAVYDGKRFDVASEMYPRRWARFREYEICNVVLKFAKDIIPDKPNGDSVWKQIVVMFRSEVDLANFNTSMHHNVYTSCYAIIRLLKDTAFPHLILELIRFVVLLREPLAKCALFQIMCSRRSLSR